MENFEGLIGAIAVTGLRAGLHNDTTITLVVSLNRMIPDQSRYGESIILILPRLLKILAESRQAC